MTNTRPPSTLTYVIVTIVAALFGGSGTHWAFAKWADSLPPQPSIAGHFGQWDSMESGTTYKAPSDGFVLVNTTGSHNETGVRIELDGELCARTAQRYRTALCPVAEGVGWRVVTRPAGVVNVRWLPIESVGGSP